LVVFAEAFSMQSGAGLSLLEYAHINEMQEELRRKLSESQNRDLGQVDSLRSAVLSLVVGENYDRAKEELLAYVELKSAFPAFQDRAQRYMQHCVELIQAIQTKRNFPGLTTLSLAKQQEIHEKVLEHFEDLKQHLKQIEKMEREQKLADVRSTVWVLRMLCCCAFVLLAVGLLVDIRDGAFMSFWSVSDGVLEQVSERIVGLLHL
jgi:hypothetical protein